MIQLFIYFLKKIFWLESGADSSQNKITFDLKTVKLKIRQSTKIKSYRKFIDTNIKINYIKISLILINKKYFNFLIFTDTLIFGVYLINYLKNVCIF